jgi:hypothetical protein
MESCTYSITSINKAMNYIIHYTDKSGKNYQLNYIVSIAGSKKKKAMFAEIYQMFHEGFSEHLIIPKAEESIRLLDRGTELNLAKAVINHEQITVPKVMKRKQTVSIPRDKVQIVHRDGSGGFDIQNVDNTKERGFFQYAMPEVRELLATLEKLYPENAEVYN